MTLTSLDLPVEAMQTGPAITPDVQATAPSPSGWDPAKSHDWAVYPNPDGTSSLVVRILPLACHPLTGIGQFAQHFVFDIMDSGQ